MKILYNIAGTCHSGGMERVLSNKTNWLVQHGYQVVIVTTDQKGRKPFFPLDERIVCYDLDVNYEDNNGRSIWNKLWQYPAKQLKHKQGLTRVLMKEHPDITVSMFCNDVSFVSSIKDGSMKVLEIHFSKFKRLQYGRKGLWKLADIWRHKQEESEVKKFDKFVVLTKEDQGYWGELDNIQVIPNARSFEIECPAELNEKKVIAVGRYCHQKSFDKLIDAWSIVCQEVGDWKLHLVGDGEDREQLQKQIEELGLMEKVVLGRAETDMKTVYSNASILALSSRYEGLPMVLLEAQAAGLPVVSFDCKCGPKDVLTDGVDGILVKEGDVDGLANGLLRLIKNPLLRKQMGAAAYMNSERFSDETVMGQWIELFNVLTSN